MEKHEMKLPQMVRQHSIAKRRYEKKMREVARKAAYAKPSRQGTSWADWTQSSRMQSYDNTQMSPSTRTYQRSIKQVKKTNYRKSPRNIQPFYQQPVPEVYEQ